MIWGFSGPIVGPIANAAGDAMTGTAAKVAEATGVTSAIKTGGDILTQAGGALFGHTVSVRADTAYALSMFESLACFKYSAIGLFGFAIVGLACWNVVKIMNKHARS